MTAVTLTGVSRASRPVGGVRDLTLTIPDASVTCLLGPTGSGKTTVLRLLAGLDRPDVGSITADGVEISCLTPERRRFALVSGGADLFPNLTARQNVELAADRAGDVDVDDLLERFGLGPHARKRPDQLTALQRVRTALARALAARPRVLLLDEPTATLGPHPRSVLVEDVRSAHLIERLTTVVATQDPDHALRLADQIAVLHAGRLEQVGSSLEVYRRPTTEFVADFTGPVNLIPARGRADGRWHVLDDVVDGTRLAHDGAVDVAAIRPEGLTLTTGGAGQVVDVAFRGALTRVEVADGRGASVFADVLSIDAGDIRVGMSCGVRVATGLGSVGLVGHT